MHIHYGVHALRRAPSLSDAFAKVHFKRIYLPSPYAISLPPPPVKAAFNSKCSFLTTKMFNCSQIKIIDTDGKMHVNNSWNATSRLRKKYPGCMWSVPKPGSSADVWGYNCETRRNFEWLSLVAACFFVFGSFFAIQWASNFSRLSRLIFIPPLSLYSVFIFLLTRRAVLSITVWSSRLHRARSRFSKWETFFLDRAMAKKAYKMASPNIGTTNFADKNRMFARPSWFL